MKQILYKTQLRHVKKELEFVGFMLSEAVYAPGRLRITTINPEH
ncbi:MAG TPA: hypothetical protein VGC76_06625 [Pyrinomonadaceae bacterium]|jgi:hypothetical protein